MKPTPTSGAFQSACICVIGGLYLVREVKIHAVIDIPTRISSFHSLALVATGPGGPGSPEPFALLVDSH